jgi:hypothetical protein
MANIALRNPQYKFIAIPSSGVQSVECTITINTVLRYTLVKNVSPSTGCNFDISELVRDYLEITYSSTYAADTVLISTNLKNYSGLNGTGSQVGSTVNYTDVGWEAYGYFPEGSNPVVPFTANHKYLLAGNYGKLATQWNIYVPYGVSGYVHYMTSAGVYSVSSYNGTDTQIVNQGSNICYINRIDCTKYGSGRKITFINRYGVQQDLWFFLKEVTSLNRTNEKYQSNTIQYPDDEYAQYEINNAPNKIFNTQGKQMHTLSSGYYPEYTNQFFEQLLLSEYVWLTRPKKENPAADETIPVTVKTSNMKFKTSVNDRLIEYTIDFEEAFDLINNIR